MKNLAIIPARSGSKGIPDKNIVDLCGKPLIAYSIIQALESGQFGRVMVSTDSEKYARISREYGAEVPFLRSEVNSSDTAGSWEMVKEVLDNYKKLGEEFDSICLLQPTSPLRSAEDIVNAYKMFCSKACVSVVSVCEMEHSPLWSNTLPADCSLDGFIKPGSGKRRQDNDKYFRLNGAIYIVNVKELYINTFLYREGSFAYVMPTERSVDIDSINDLNYAEFLIRYRKNDNKTR